MNFAPYLKAPVGQPIEYDEPVVDAEGKLGLAIPALALAGLFAQQQTKPVTDGTLPTETFLFGGLVIATVLLVSALSYLPVLALGPVVEHLMLR
jgi:K+-transporting ATPase ATPase A chain